MSCEGFALCEMGEFIESISETYNLKNIEKIIFLNTSDIYEGNVLNFKQVSTADLPGQAKKRIKKGDILFSEIRPANGRYALIDFNSEKFVVSTKLMVLRFKSGGCDPKFFYKYLTSKPVLAELQSIAEHRSGTFPQITFDQLKKITIPLPPLPEQRAIARILSSLDDKIELNNRMNKTLEEMAQAIFKRWFVDFEFPDENGNPYKSSGGKMVESELGLIPEGWRVGTVEALGTIVGGGTPSKTREDFYCNSGIAWITPKDLSNCSDKYISHGATDITHEGYRNSSAKIMPPGTVLFSSRAPIGYLAIALSEISTNQGFKSIVPNKGYGSEFVYYLMKYITPEIENQATGSTFKEVSGGELKSYKIILPNLTIAETFSILIGSSGKQRQKNEQESQILTQLRDVLLPKLMSGEIRVPVTEDKLDD